MTDDIATTLADLIEGDVDVSAAADWVEEEFAARDEQLAEMREYITHRGDCPVRTLMASMSIPTEDIQKAVRIRCNCGYFDLLNSIREKQR